jgi:protein SCO1
MSHPDRPCDLPRRKPSLPSWLWRTAAVYALVLLASGAVIASYARYLALPDLAELAERTPAASDARAVVSQAESRLVSTERTERPSTGKRSDRIPDVELLTHAGQPVYFYTDLVKGKKVVVNFLYTVCKGICPGMTKNMREVREQLAAAGRDDYVFLSLSIEPDVDTPERLRRYMQIHGIENEPGKPQWYFLTGELEAIDQVRRSLGVYELDPVVDSDRTQHGGVFTYGNDVSDWWGAIAALSEPGVVTETILRITGDDERGHPGSSTPPPMQH